MYMFNRITVNPQLPTRINKLTEISNNLWWSWNTDFLKIFKEIDADFFSIQETKMQEGQLDLNIEGYHYYMSSAIKKGYSGTLVYTKKLPLNVKCRQMEKYVNW